MNKEKFYITTPIYYVNAKPHIGHTYTTIAADVLARFHRIKGDATFFATGTDEHGIKIEKKAEESGKELKNFVDEVAGEFIKSWQKMNITNDRFIRTTEESHKSAVQKALQRMYEKGDIYLDAYEGLYCQGCEQFKNEKDLVDGKCPDHQTVPENMREETYMFRMSKYADELFTKINNDELKISPAERKNEIISFYQEGLKDVSFSRKNVKWGIPIPWDTSHTAYVWADAFLNYLTVLGWDGKDDSAVNKYWPCDLQLMSKDILRVHATIWPAMLLSLGLPLPKEIFVHGFFQIDGQKMSKSLGNVISPDDLINKYGVDSTRFLLMSATVFGRDGDISWEKFDLKYTADLANGLGNLVARTSNLIEKNGLEFSLAKNSDKDLTDKFSKELSVYNFDGAINLLWSKLREMDEFISIKAPWKMKDKNEISVVLETVAQNILNVANLLQPFMPETAEKIILQFSAKQIRKSESLFPRLVN